MLDWRAVANGGGSSSGRVLAPLGLLAALVAACAGDRIVVGGQLPATLGELVDADAGASRDGGTSTGVGVPARCPDSPGERREVLGCWPTRQVGSWRGFWLGLPRYETASGDGSEFPPGDVVLRFGADGAGTFSVGERLPSARVACEGQRLDGSTCAPVGELLGGFEYHLERIRLEDAGERGTPRVIGESAPRVGELMEFELRLGEPWDAACLVDAAACQQGVCPSARDTDGSASATGGGPNASAPASCVCGPDRCLPVAPTLALALTLSEDGLALRGVYRPRDVRLAAVGLELVKLEEP
jgi:hypothetical protein